MSDRWCLVEMDEGEIGLVDRLSGEEECAVLIVEGGIEYARIIRDALNTKAPNPDAPPEERVHIIPVSDGTSVALVTMGLEEIDGLSRAVAALEATLNEELVATLGDMELVAIESIRRLANVLDARRDEMVIT